MGGCVCLFVCCMRVFFVKRCMLLHGVLFVVLPGKLCLCAVRVQVCVLC